MWIVSMYRKNKKHYIAHRGNLDGKIPEKENHPEYIVAAILKGYEVEIDVWYQNKNWYLGHDGPVYPISYNFLDTWGTWLWVHAKSYGTLQHLCRTVKTRLNYFYHTDEHYVITSQNWIWAYPGEYGESNTICVLPETTSKTPEQIAKFDGVCSDYIEQYKK